MSYPSRAMTSKLFQLTSLSCALALAGCGGGDGTDTIAPKPDLGPQPGEGGNGGNTGGGGTTTPPEKPDFFLQNITINPSNIEISDNQDEQTEFTATVKALKVGFDSGVSDQEVTLKVADSVNSGAVTIEGQSEQLTDGTGNAVYELKLNPQAIKDEVALLKNGFTLIATSKKADGTIVEQIRSVPVSRKGAGGGSQVVISDLIIKSEIKTTSVSNNTLNVYGDTATFSVIVEDKNKVRAEGVTVGLGLASTDGVSITGGNNKVTDKDGIATFDIKLKENLSKEARDALIQQGVTYNISIKEKNGATKQELKKLPVALPISDYTLKVDGVTNAINAYGDTKTLTITANPINNKVPTQITGAAVSIKLNNAPEGVTLAKEQLVLDAAGKATVDLNVSPNLDETARQKLAKDGISYTVTLSEPNRSTTAKTFTNQVVIPQAQYQVSFESNSKTKISSYGSSAIVTFRLTDRNNGGPIADQNVTATLPKALRDAGLLTLDSAATQKTNAQGLVTYTIRIPKNLSADKRALLEQAGVTITAAMKEASGVISSDTSTKVQVTAESETVITSTTIPSVVNVLKDQFQIQVSGKRPDGSTATGKEVKLNINNINGISVQGNTQTTDNAGNATFTINIDPSLTSAQREALTKLVIPYTVTLTDDDGIVTKNDTFKVAMPIADYGITFGTTSKDQLSSSGDTTVISFRVNDTKGGVIAGQSVTAVLPKELISAGLLTLDSAATQVTDAKGMVSYSVSVPAGLSAERKAQLEAIGGFELIATIIEESGASSEATSERVSVKKEAKVSKTTLSSKSIPSIVNVLKDQFQIQVSGKRPNGNAAAGKVVTLAIDGVDGVSVQGNTQTTDAAGNATFTVNIDPSLTRTQREELAKSVIPYTVTLTDDDGIVTKTYNVQAAMPVADYQLNFGTSSNSQLSSSGGSTIISFRVNDKATGGVIAGQRVTAVLPKALRDAGLLTLDSAATQVTDDKGMVSYNVSVPAGLSTDDKAQLEAIGGFELTAAIIEDSGASSTAMSKRVSVQAEAAVSDIVMTSISTPKIVSTSDSQFNIQVSGKRPNGSAAAGKVVKLALDNLPVGVSIEGNEQTTNAAGNAVFTLNISQDLTPTQRDALVASGISYTATVIDGDTEAKVSNTVTVKQPATSIDFASILTPTISELGGSGSITIKLLTKDAPQTPVNGQKVDIVLGAKARDYGVTLSQTSATTDFNGEATYVIDVPTGLTRKQRDELKRIGINYQLSYVEKGITYNSEIQQVTLFQPAVALSILNAPTSIGNRDGYTLNEVGDSITIQAQLSNKTDNTQIASQPIELNFNDKSLAKLLTVNGNAGSATIVANTDTDGIVSFEILVPSNLTPDEKQALRNQILTATLTETLTAQTQDVNIKVQSMVANISLIDTQSNPLNLNGGETQIEVTAKDDKGDVVAGQKVFLALPAVIASQGVTLVSGNSQTTDDSGRATFTLAVPNNLTKEQKDAIAGMANSFIIVFSAADASGNIATQTSTVTTVTPDATTGIKENLTIGANKVVNTKGDTFKVFVRVAKNDGGSIANREVTLSVDDPIKTGVTITNNTVTTNGDGVATFDLKLEDGANVNQAILEAGIKLTATTTTADNLPLEQNYIVAVDKATIESYQILASSEKSTLRTGGDQTTATFRVTDSRGGILVGVPLQLSIDNLAASGAALTTASVVTTDASGKVDVGVLLAAGSVNARLNGEIKVNAKIVTPRYDANGDVTMEVREEKSLSLSTVGTEITLSATETKLKDGGLATITTRLVDGSGRAIANAGMELVNSDNELITTNATTTTNADGEASFDINEANLTFINGNLRVFARALGENSINTQRSLNSINLVKVSQAGISFIDIENLYDVNEPQTINVQIRTDSPEKAAELIGKELEVQTTIGKFANNDVITTRAITASDITGSIITVPVVLTSSLAGTAVLQATVLGVNVNGQPKYQTVIDTRFRATTPSKMLFQAVKSVITPGGSTEVVATVKDKNDVPVEGQTVVFSRTADSSAGRLSAATAVTDSKGEARVVYLANASSPIGGVVINARLLDDKFGVPARTTTITVSEEAVYTTLAFSNKLESDDIYYTVRGSISVMDGSGRAVPNQEVSIKSYATEYAQGKVCLLDSTVTYQGATVVNPDKTTTTPDPISFSEQTPIFLQSGWIPTEDSNYNYTLDKDSITNEDGNIDVKPPIRPNGSLEAINPVAIIGGTVSGDGYSFVTDSEGRADFAIRYPLRYSNWVKVQFDASTFVNGSENTQTINYQLPSAESDLIINGSNLDTPWIDNASPFGTGGAACVDSMSVSINENTARTIVALSPYYPEMTPNPPNYTPSNYAVTINGVNASNETKGTGIYFVDFNQAFSLGSVVGVSNNGVYFNRVIKLN